MRILDWLQLPELASLHGATVDAMDEFVHLFMMVLFIGWTIFFLYCCWRFWHRNNPKADYTGVRSHASSHVEVAVVIVEAILLIGFAMPFWAQRVAAFPTGPDVCEVRAVAYQYGWGFHYPGADGKFGRVSTDLYPTDPVGLDREDPNGIDDIVKVGMLQIPKDRPVLIHVTSKDVIHNFSVVPFRVSQDAIPGTEYPLWFTPTKTGSWDLICGQLCGAGHGSMRAEVTAVEPEDFDKWLVENAPQPPAAPAPAEG